MRLKSWWVRAIGGLCLLGALSACGGGGEDEASADRTDGAHLRTSDGAAIKMSDASQLADVTVRVSRNSSGAPPLPVDVEPVGPSINLVL